MPDIYSTADGFRASLLRQERAAATELVKAYAEVWQRLQTQIRALAAQMAEAGARGEEVSHSWLLRSNRLQSLQLQIEVEIRRFARFADALITLQQREAVRAAQSHAEQLLLFNLPDEARAVITATFNRLPVEATQSLIGFVGNGSPLGELLDELAPDAGARARDALVEAVALGRGPRVLAREIRDALGGNLARALTIARTETLRAYREASHQIYKSNRDMLNGWIWRSRLAGNTCALCVAMHGTRHKPDERLESHPNCRCVMVPQTKTWAELGFEGISETRPQIETGVEWFARQDAETQRRILGPDGYEAFTALRKSRE